mgnify:CR=1 FL=1
MGAARAVGEAEHSRRNKRTAATAESTFAPLLHCDANDAQLHGRLTIDDAVSVLEQHEQYLLKAQNSLMADIEARIASIAAYVAYDALFLSNRHRHQHRQGSGAFVRLQQVVGKDRCRRQGGHGTPTFHLFLYLTSYLTPFLVQALSEALAKTAPPS